MGYLGSISVALYATLHGSDDSISFVDISASTVIADVESVVTATDGADVTFGDAAKIAVEILRPIQDGDEFGAVIHRRGRARIGHPPGRPCHPLSGP